MIRTRLLPILASLALFAACDNPAKDKPQASVSAPVENTGASAAGATSFLINPQNSKIEWTGAKITASHNGSFGAFTGSIDVPGGVVDNGKVSVDIDTSSITVDPAQLNGHLKSPDFFDVAKFPKATFVSTSIKDGGEKGATHTVTGNLTLHGVTKSVSFPATIAVAGDTVNATAEFSINRKDFGLVYPGKPDDLIRDDVVIKLTAHAQKKS
jgi:polyisoprenoid-binding protein YceI